MKNESKRVEAPKVVKRQAKRDTITIRLTPEWDEYIDQIVKELTPVLEWDVTKTWVVTQLMKYGLPVFEKKHNVRRKEIKNKSA